MNRLWYILFFSAAVLVAASQGSGEPLLNGAGSTFDYPAFTKWFEAYSKVDPSAKLNYQSIGSGGGQRQLLNQTVEFGASDGPMSQQTMAKASGRILEVPILAGGVAIIYNLPGRGYALAGRPVLDSVSTEAAGEVDSQGGLSIELGGWSGKALIIEQRTRAGRAFGQRLAR